MRQCGYSFPIRELAQATNIPALGYLYWGFAMLPASNRVHVRLSARSLPVGLLHLKLPTSQSSKPPRSPHIESSYFRNIGKVIFR